MKPYQLRVERVEVVENIVRFRFGVYLVGDPQTREAQSEETEDLELPASGLRVSDLSDLARTGALRLAKRLHRAGGYEFQL